LLFDNAPIDDAPGDTFLNINGTSVLRHPPYSQDFLPIESVFNDFQVIIPSFVHFNPQLLQDSVRLQARATSCIT